MATETPARLRLRLLGPVDAQPGEPGAPLPALRRKSWAVLAYLATTGKRQPRSSLTGLFCQEADTPARALSVLLSRIRGLGAELIHSDGDNVWFNAGAAWVDCLAFAQTLDGRLASRSLAELERAVDLYRGEFLEGLSLPDSAGFEIWLLGQRAQMRHLYERGLGEIVARQIAEGAYEAATSRAQELLQSNPLLEEAHGRLIWLYAQGGRRDAALAQYALCRDTLWRELGVEPEAELQALVAEIAAGRPVAAPAEQAGAPSVAGPSPAAALVGREGELGLLAAAWQGATDGQGSVFLISGEAGTGKSRLVDEFGRRLPAGSYAAGRCYESTSALPYHPWAEILETLLDSMGEGGLDRLPGFVREALAQLLPGRAAQDPRRLLPSAAETDREQLFTAVRVFLKASVGPLLLFVDDLQWAGETSLHLFHFLARHAASDRLLLVGAYRAEEVDSRPAFQALLGDLQGLPVSWLALPALSPESVDRLAAQLWPRLPEGYRPHVAAMLAEATGGNALFVTELLRELAGGSELPAELPVPRTVRDLVRRRLSQLPGRQQQVIEALAVVHSPATLDGMREMSGRSEEEAALAVDWGLRRGLLQVETGSRPARYDFQHALLREAVAGQIGMARRDLLHRRAARWLEQSGAPAALLAYHWEMAGDAAKEGLYAALAGEQAAAVYANEEAVRYFEQALAILSEGRRRVEVLGRLGDVWLLVGRWAEAEAIYRQAIAAAGESGDRTLQAREMGALGRLLEFKGQYAEALDWLVQAREGGDATLAARLAGEMGRVYWRQGAYARALAQCEEALAASRALGDREGAAGALNTLGLVHWHQERHDAALACFEEACAIYREAGQRASVSACLGNIGNVYKDREDYAQALAYYREALEMDETLGNRMGIARHLGNMGIVHYNLAAYDEAQRSYEQALAIDEELGHLEGVARHLGNIGNIFWQRGQYDQTLVYYRRALAIDEQAGNRRGVALHLGNMGVIYSRCGATEPALACLARALEEDLRLGNRLGVARHLGNLADLYRRQGATGPALAACDRAIRLLEELNNQFHLSWHWMTKAKILAARGEYAEALALSERGRQAAETVQRQDTLFGTQLLSATLQGASGQVGVAVAARNVAALLAVWPAPEQHAAIIYAGWLLDRDDDTARRDAAARYEALWAKTPDAGYRQRYEELAGRMLPDPPPLPALPESAAGAEARLPALLEQVDALIEG